MEMTFICDYNGHDDDNTATLGEIIYVNVHDAPQMEDEDIVRLCKMPVGDVQPFGMIHIKRMS